MHGIDFIAVVSAHGSEAGVAAVFGAEETDGGGLKGFVGLFKLKGGLRFGCVCVCKPEAMVSLGNIRAVPESKEISKTDFFIISPRDS